MGRVWRDKRVVRYVEFSLSTIPGMVMDTLILWMLAHFVLDGTYWGENVVSPIVSFECSVVTNFTVAYFLVWRDRISHRSGRSYMRHFVPYNVSCVGAMVLRLSLLQVFVVSLPWDVVVCNWLTLPFSGLFNFVMNEWVIFRKRKPGDGDGV